MAHFINQGDLDFKLKLLELAHIKKLLLEVNVCSPNGKQLYVMLVFVKANSVLENFLVHCIIFLSNSESVTVAYIFKCLSNIKVNNSEFAEIVQNEEPECLSDFYDFSCFIF